MNYLLWFVSFVLAILAAILGWSFGPHHCFTCLAAAVAAYIAAAIAVSPIVTQRV